MNRHVNFCKSAVATWFSAAFVTVLPVAAAPVAQPVTPEVVQRSVFIIPSNRSEGRDPFFPTSMRPYENTNSKTPAASDLTALVLKGISGPADHRLAIINNHTFGVGDEGDVLASHSRIHLRCIEIKAKSVVVESGGQRHELSYTSSP
jgi:hypothetical protein